MTNFENKNSLITETKMAFYKRRLRSKCLFRETGKLPEGFRGDHPAELNKHEGRKGFSLTALGFSFFWAKECTLKRLITFCSRDSC